MTWFKVDDCFADHPKVLALQASKHWKGAIALWTLSGAWSSKHLTDGRIPTAVVQRLGGTRAEAEALVSVGLWVPTDDGYAFHDWLDRNPSRTRIEERREMLRQRVTRHREKRAGNALHDASETQGVTPPPSRPVPTIDPPNPHRESSAVADLALVPAEPKVDRVAEVFDYWREVMGHERAKLDPKRRRVITAALKLYSVDDCKRAIDGCRASPWHMGENDRRERYDGLDLIFRNADKIDGFIAKAPAGQRAEKVLAAVRQEPTDDALERARQRLAAQRAGVGS